jgi:signal transduction histidine kinase
MKILLLEDTDRVADLIDQELQRNGLAPVLWRVDSAAGLAQALQELHCDVVVSAPMAEQEAMATMQTRERPDQLALEEALASFKAAVSNMPGMVFEMKFAADGTSTLAAVSEGARDLFHTTPELLMQDRDAIGSRVVPEDLSSFMQSRRAAFLKQADWNWTGRIRIAEMNEVKWIDLRSKVRRRADTSTCWDGIILNITRSRVADIKARRAHEELARLTKHVDSVEQQQRSHIAREIHDELGGTLTAIKIMLNRLSTELTGSKALQLVQTTGGLVDATIDTTRRIATSLRPAMLDLGILAAVEWHAAEFEKRMDIKCQVTCGSEEIELDRKHSSVVFRTFQEALTNVAKHAQATQVEVELDAQEDYVTLQVHDNGCGIGSQDLHKPQAFGILGMQERARSLGGQASVQRTPNGTTVMLRIPRISSSVPLNQASA